MTIERPHKGLGSSLLGIAEVLALPDDPIISFAEGYFATPSQTVALACLLNRPETPFRLHAPSLTSYQQQMGVPNGIPLADFHATDYPNKNYSPLLRLPPLDASFQEVFNHLGACMERLGIRSDIRKAVTYLVSESVDNITQHAEATNGWLQFQFYPEMETLVIALADDGRGIRAGYQANGFDDVHTDVDALQKAVNGQSTKIKDEGRGYGIRTTRRMLHEGLQGLHLIWSGNALASPDAQTQQDAVFSFSGNGFPGTLVAMRVRITAEHFQFYSFLE